MGKMLAALLRLQSVERQLAQVRQRLNTRRNAVAGQQRRIDQLKADYDALHDRARQRQKDADRLGLDLKEGEEKVSKFRAALNTAKTNKEYAAILTQINTLKADNAKQEDEVLRIMQDAEGIRSEGEKVKVQMQAEAKRLEEIALTSATEIQRLEAMHKELSSQREQAAKEISPEFLTAFERIAENYDGEAMALVEVHGKKPPHDYVCGGCYMSLNAEHANALATRDEIRTCDNCGRILYLEAKAEKAKAD
jgi:predicted  nucleic acid-binding Zn-ribbon protein